MRLQQHYKLLQRSKKLTSAVSRVADLLPLSSSLLFLLLLLQLCLRLSPPPTNCDCSPSMHLVPPPPALHRDRRVEELNVFVQLCHEELAGASTQWQYVELQRSAWLTKPIRQRVGLLAVVEYK